MLNVTDYLPTSGGADVSGVTATAGDVDASNKFVTASGVLTDGTLSAAVQPAPTVSVNSGTGLVTASYSPVAGRVTDTAAKSATLQLTVKAAATITPGTEAQTISAGQFLTGAQTISGDSNLVASNIKDGITIFGVTGEYEGEGGTDTSDATAVAGDILSGKTAYVSTGKVTGSITTKAAATYTPGTTDQTISAGQYLGGVQTISGDANLVAGNIKNGVSIFGVQGSYTGGGSGTDTSDATATAADILSGVTAYIASGKVSGSIQTVTASLSGNVVTVPAGYIASAQTITVGTAKAAATYTPTTSDQTIASGQYLTGAQTIKGDANLVAANIASGVTIFGVTGTHSGGGGGGGSAVVDAVKVTAFQEYRAAFTANSVVTLSGFVEDQEMGMDYTAYNDTYTVTPATQYETDWKKRVYEKTNKVYGYTYYLYYYEYDEDDPPMMLSGDAWMIGSTVGSSYGSLWFETNSDIAAGSMTWQDEMYTSPTCTAAVTTMSEPAQQALFTGVKATAYNSSTKLFTWSGTTTTLTGYDRTPQVHQVYLSNGTKLIGGRACSGIVPPEVVFYLNPAQYGMLDVAGGLTGVPTKTGMISNGVFVFDGTSYITFDTTGVSELAFGTAQDCTIEWFSKTTARTTSYPAEITNGTSWTTNCFALRYSSGAENRTYACYWNPSDPLIGGQNDYALSTRRHIAFVRSGSTAKLFVDGVLEGSADCSGKLLDFTQFGVLRLGCGTWDGNNGYFTGEIGEVKITKQALYSAAFNPPNALL